MKKITTLLSTILISGAAFAQIPNSGFETWTAHTGYDTPDGWGNLNALTSLASTYTCEKGTPGAPGSSYLKLTSRSTPLGTVPGITGTGTLNTTAFTISGGFPYSSRPATFNGNWQYMASGSDAGHMAILLSKWNATTNKRDTVAFTDHVLSGMQMSWAPFSINLNYVSGKVPDTGMIVLSSSGTAPVANSYLYVDSLGFAGSMPSGVVNVTRTGTAANIYPNPASGNTNISYYSADGGNINVTVMDIKGRSVQQMTLNAAKGENTFPINIANLATGIYVVRITGDQGVEEKKLIVE